MVALACVPGPKQPMPQLMPTLPRTGPLTITTGAEGFVGGRLVPRLVARGAAVIACHAPGTVIANDDDAGARVPVERITLDIRDRDTVDRVFRDTAPDAVVHLAGLSDVQAQPQS